MISLFLLLFQGCIAANNNITPSNPLSQEQVLTSSGQSFELGFFQPNNSVDKYVGIWYKDITPRRYVWVANRQKPVTDSLTSLTVGTDGNLQLLDGSNKVTLWSTNVSISSSNNTIAELLDNGNFALKDGLTGQNLWQSFDHPSDTLLPGGSFGVNSKTGERRVLTSWRSENDPSPGSFVLGLNPDQSPPQAYVWKGSVPYWRSGLWDKTTFIGIPDMDSSYSSVFEIKADKEQGTVYFYANPYNQSVFNVFLSSVGYLQTNVRGGGDSLTVNWEVPSNPCDIYGTCGPFGVCKASESPICSCLKGFEPYSDEEWSKGNWTRGCVRRNELLCEANPNSSATKNRGNVDDGFWKMDRMKVPDYSEIIDIDSSQCQQWCLNNCSCMAYAVVYGIGCLVWRGNLTDMQEFSFGGQEFFLRLTLCIISSNT
ncbi:S-locus glycoprotein [Corchorus olitorius]|uniref:S-locus glycoprotein n=1 Tax=Corchorus olitorius TaxID=93759 RepID=A0A1R3JID2_9ROSI|nr:S-locus glycoprotein [Corchorus olitorius]